MRIPCRCNRRACQARRSLPKRPELYVRWPRCRVSGCSGRLYVDEYRLRQGEHDHPPICREDCLPHPHLVSTRECRHREDHVVESALKSSRHRPFVGESCSW